MKRVLVALVIAATSAACGPRRVEVVSAGQSGTAAAVQLNVNNTLSQAVNVYVVSGGAETFLRQVGANASETVPVRGVVPGSTVTLRAVPADGRNTYTRENVVLSGTYDWRLP